MDYKVYANFGENPKVKYLLTLLIKICGILSIIDLVINGCFPPNREFPVWEFSAVYSIKGCRYYLPPFHYYRVFPRFGENLMLRNNLCLLINIVCSPKLGSKN